MTAHSVDTPVPSCRDCIHFEDDPAEIERRLPSIRILGSAWGSTRGNAGLCAALDRFHDPIPAVECPLFEARSEDRRRR